MDRGGGKDCPGPAWGLGQPAATSSDDFLYQELKGGEYARGRSSPTPCELLMHFPVSKMRELGPLKRGLHLRGSCPAGLPQGKH